MLPTFLAAFATLLLSCPEGLVAPFWPANAVVVALLLVTRTDRWWMGLAAGGSGLMAAAALDGDLSATALSLSLGNLLEILLCAGLVRRAVGDALDLRRPPHLLALLFAAGVFAPACSATYAATLLAATRGIGFQKTWLAWYAGDAFGLLLIAPLLLIVWQIIGRRPVD